MSPSCEKIERMASGENVWQVKDGLMVVDPARFKIRGQTIEASGGQLKRLEVRVEALEAHIQVT